MRKTIVIMSGGGQSAGSQEPSVSGVSLNLRMFYGTRHAEPQAQPASPSSGVIVKSDDDQYDSESDFSSDDNMSDTEWLPSVMKKKGSRGASGSENVPVVMQLGEGEGVGGHFRDPVLAVAMGVEERRPSEEGSEGGGSAEGEVSQEAGEEAGVVGGLDRASSASGSGEGEGEGEGEEEEEGVNLGEAGRAVRGSGRKRAAQPEKWGKTIAKRRRNLGLAYTSYATKKEMAARKVGTRCTCSKDCFTVLGREQIDGIFDAFWKIGNYDSQNQYLQSLIREEKPKRKRTTAEVSRRIRTCHYFVKVAYRDVEVCRHAFLSIHGITTKKLSILMQKRTEAPSGTPTSDQRGKKPSPRAIAGPTLDYVHDHIQQLPVFASHYSRTHAPFRRYMERGVTIEDLHSEYSTWMAFVHPDGNVVSPRFYRTVFTRWYNIVFTLPKSDLCSTCELFKAKINVAKEQNKPFRKLQESLETHTAAASVPQELLSEAEKKGRVAPADSDLRTIAMDLQQTLPCPRLRVSVAYYKRKIWLYNFCIYDLNKDRASMFLWDETTAKRGADEIASCIVKWIDAEFATGQPFKRLRIFADNCAGQNKNLYIMLMALRIVHSKRLERIEIVFMVPGHSYLPCDRAFGHIEQRLKKRRSMFCPADYVKVIQGAVTKENVIFMMQREEFFSFRSLASSCTVRKTVGFSKARQLTVDSQFMEGYFIRNHYMLDHPSFPVGCENDVKVRLMPGKARYNDTFNLASVELPRKYARCVKLTAEKLKDLRSMYNFLDIKGRKWAASIFKEQEKADESSGQETEDEDVDEDNDTWEYVPVVRLPA